MARKKVKEAEVLRVEAFTIESNLTSNKPSIHTYAGPAYLVRNREKNCYQGISVPTELFVDVMCDEENFVDDALSNWVESAVSSDRKMRSQKIDNYPFTHIRCWGHTINVTGDVQLCPPFPFRLPSSNAWQTSDGVKHSPSVMELNVNLTNVSYNYQIQDGLQQEQIHLKSDIKLFDAREALFEIHRLRSNLTNLKTESIAVQLPNETIITFKHLFIFTSLIFIIAFKTYVAIMFYLARKREKQTKRRHHEIMKTMVDKEAGDGTYEQLKNVEKETRRKSKEERYQLRTYLANKLAANNAKGDKQLSTY